MKWWPSVLAGLTEDEARVEAHPRMVGAALRMREFFNECPKNAREPGACEVERTAGWEGISFDPGLLSLAEVWELAELAVGNDLPEERTTDRVERLVRHTERVRSSEEWPEEMNEYTKSIMAVSDAAEALHEYEIGSPEFERALRRFRHEHVAAFKRSEWALWWAENMEDNSE